MYLYNYLSLKSWMRVQLFYCPLRFVTATEATELSYTLYTLRTISSNIILHPWMNSELRDAFPCEIRV